MKEPIKDKKRQKPGLIKEVSSDQEKNFKSSESKQRDFINQVIRVSSLAWTLVVMMVLGILFGQWLDKQFDKQPLFTVLFFLVSMVAVVRYLYDLARKL